MNPKLSFTPLTAALKAEVLAWFKTEHVAQFFYGDGLQNTLNNIDLYCQGINHNGRYAFDHWVAWCDGTPFGFLMTSPIAGPYDAKDPYKKWFIADRQTITLDLLIGPETFLGQGLAAPMINGLLHSPLLHADYCLIDPAEANTKAIHVYQQAGFQPVERFFPSFDPTVAHIMMRMAISNSLSPHCHNSHDRKA